MQKVQNQQSSLADRPLRLVVEEAMELESQSMGGGGACKEVSIGLNASEANEGIGNGLGLVGLRPER